MNAHGGPLDRLEARLEQLAARVDELSRIVERLDGAASPAAHKPVRRKRRRHVGHASRI